MRIRIQEGLPYVTVTLTYQGQQRTLDKVILDTGSAGTVFSIHHVSSIGLLPGPNDAIHRITGVGGSEFVFAKTVDNLAVGDLHVNRFVIEIGGMDYGLDLEGLIGMDFLLHTGAVIDLAHFEIRRSSSP